jgi:uncharacterized protein (UPF0332 family)
MSFPLYEANKAIEKAEDAIEQAKANLQMRFPIVVANRSYYAAYYCIVALLYTQNVYTKTHQGAHTKFAELFIKTSLFPIHSSDIVNNLFEYRQEADYDFDADISQDEAKELIFKATQFLQLTKDYFHHLAADNAPDNNQ